METIIIEYRIAIHDGPNRGKTIDFTANMDDLELDSLSSLLIEDDHINSWCNRGEFHVVSRKINMIDSITVKAKFLFELPNKQAWVHRVPECLPDKTDPKVEKWIWVDKNGFTFEIGEDFAAAEAQDSYPCKVYKLIRVVNANTLKS